jgi:hypothetical protein
MNKEKDKGSKMAVLKGVWHEIFNFIFFSWISVPQAPEYSNGAFQILLKIWSDILQR